jgi:hypothetical protein
VDYIQRKRHEAEARRYDQEWITDRESEMRPKKSATISSGSQTEEVT